MSEFIKEHVYTFTPQPINWGAIIAGLLLTVASSWLLYTLGSAFGLSLFELFNSAANYDASEAFNLSVTLLVWVFISSLIAFFLGGLLAGRLAGKPDRAVGLLHGVTVWSSAMVLSLLLGILGVGGIASSAWHAAQTAATAVGAVSLADHGQSSSDGASPIPPPLHPVVAMLNAETRKASVGMATGSTRVGLSDRSVRMASEQLDMGTSLAIAGALVRDDKAYAKNLLTSATTLSDAEADQLLSKLQGRVEEATAAIKKQADETEDYLTGVLWIAFASIAGSLLASIFGGWMGVASVSRIYALKLY